MNMWQMRLKAAAWLDNAEEMADLLAARRRSQNDVNAVYDGGRTALHWAVKGGGLACVEMLLIHGADPNVIDDVLRTPIGYLDRDTDPLIIRLLLGYGASPHVLDAEGRNALYFAASAPNRRAVEILLEFGASASIPSNDGLLPEEMAMASHDAASFAVLFIARGLPAEDIPKRFHQAIMLREGEIVQWLLQNGASASQTLPCGLKPTDLARLHTHPRINDPRVLQILERHEQ